MVSESTATDVDAGEERRRAGPPWCRLAWAKGSLRTSVAPTVRAVIRRADLGTRRRAGKADPAIWVGEGADHAASADIWCPGKDSNLHGRKATGT